MRVGVGYDAHGLTPGRQLVLGGVAIPNDWGLAGHSDGDVLLHAIMDAMLGAAALGDKGTHFPSSDPRNKDISSTLLLGKVRDLLAKNGWRVVNMDATIVAERPRLAVHVSQMRNTIGATLGLGREQVSIKAATNDSLGFIGRGEGIAALAVVSIEAIP